MCTYVTLAMPAAVPFDALRAVIERHKRRLHRIEHDYKRRPFLRPGDIYFHTARTCDCGTPVGWNSAACEPDSSGRTAAEQQDAEAEREAERARAKQRRKGWSQARVERWMAEKHAAAAIQSARVVTLDAAELERWTQLLRELAAQASSSRVGGGSAGGSHGGAGGLRLLIHEYAGSLENEPIANLDRASLHLRDLTPDTVAGLRWDVVYAID